MSTSVTSATSTQLACPHCRTAMVLLSRDNYLRYGYEPIYLGQLIDGEYIQPVTIDELKNPRGCAKDVFLCPDQSCRAVISHDAGIQLLQKAQRQCAGKRSSSQHIPASHVRFVTDTVAQLVAARRSRLIDQVRKDFVEQGSGKAWDRRDVLIGTSQVLIADALALLLSEQESNITTFLRIVGIRGSVKSKMPTAYHRASDKTLDSAAALFDPHYLIRDALHLIELAVTYESPLPNSFIMKDFSLSEEQITKVGEACHHFFWDE